MVIVEDYLGITKFQKKKKLIESTYKGRVDKDMSFDHLAKVVDFYSNNEVNAAIIDLRQLYGSFAKVMEYLSGSFYPVAVKSGLKAQAFILHDDLIIKHLTEKLEVITANFGIMARIFNTKEEAQEWLNSFL